MNLTPITTNELIKLLQKHDPTGTKHVRMFDVGAGVEFSMDSRSFDLEGPHVFIGLDGSIDEREHDDDGNYLKG